MFKIRYATGDDRVFWLTFDMRMDENEFALKARDRRGFVACDSDKRIGIMRYGLYFRAPSSVFRALERSA